MHYQNSIWSKFPPESNFDLLLSFPNTWNVINFQMICFLFLHPHLICILVRRHQCIYSIYIYIHTHTHTHIYIVCLCVCVCVCSRIIGVDFLELLFMKSTAVSIINRWINEKQLSKKERVATKRFSSIAWICTCKLAKSWFAWFIFLMCRFFSETALLRLQIAIQ
jgi:hypothetical protein